MDEDYLKPSLNVSEPAECLSNTRTRVDTAARPSTFKLSVVVPAFNEEQNIPVLLKRIIENAAGIPSLEVLVVDDGSTDRTAETLRGLQSKYPQLRYVLLSRNFGHQFALRAGMEHAQGDCVICLDADLQHPPALLKEMVFKWEQGADIVTCIRHDAKRLSSFKKLTSRWFYDSLSWVSGLQLVPGSSDFRLLDRKVVSILNQMPESDLFYRGIIPTLGFRLASIPYDPATRLHGKSKYTLHKMIKLALNGVISTSARPLRLATYFSFLTALGALSFLGYVLYIYFVRQSGVPGWASTLAVVLLIGTMQLLVLGVVGEYLGQVLRETRRRPPYLVSETGGFAKPSDAETDLDDDDAE